MFGCSYDVQKKQRQTKWNLEWKDLHKQSQIAGVEFDTRSSQRGALTAFAKKIIYLQDITVVMKNQLSLLGFSHNAFTRLEKL